MGFTRLVHQYFTYFSSILWPCRAQILIITITLVILYIHPTFLLHLCSEMFIETIQTSPCGLHPTKIWSSVFSFTFVSLCILSNAITFMFCNNCLFSQILSFCNCTHFYHFISIVPIILWLFLWPFIFVNYYGLFWGLFTILKFHCNNTSHIYHIFYNCHIYNIASIILVTYSVMHTLWQ